jgi:hypothetical protein
MFDNGSNFIAFVILCAFLFFIQYKTLKQVDAIEVKIRVIQEVLNAGA